MNTTQPIEDICRACLAGYHQGLLLPPDGQVGDAVERMVREYVNEELAAACRIGLEAGQRTGSKYNLADGCTGQPVGRTREQIAYLKAMLTAMIVKRTRGAAHKYITLGYSDVAAREAIFNASRVLDAAGVPREIQPGVEAPYHIAQRIQALATGKDGAR
jgi:hypothetical protein